SDVIEEYTRPARIKVDGVVMEVPALNERHLIEVEGYGAMEAFLTDG
ncbi:MAG TPA: saccharopine dehydrogenase, partial [Candidatus Poseidoniales archaeon]